MSDREIRYPAAQAMAVAASLADALRGVCARLEVVGSLRRKKPTVGDIELLFVPINEERPLDFFSNHQVSLAAERIDKWVKEGLLEKRPNKLGIYTWGEENKLAVHTESGIPVDLFSTTEPKWWNSLVCRTGGAVSNKNLAMTALGKGWSFEAYGSGFHNLGHSKRYETKSEEDVFKFVGLPFLPPERRL